jgi:hypothetical protein
MPHAKEVFWALIANRKIGISFLNQLHQVWQCLGTELGCSLIIWFVWIKLSKYLFSGYSHV